MHEDVLKILVTKEELMERVSALGKQISKDYAGKDLLLVSILKGSFVFMADLARAIDLRIEVDFMSVSSFDGVVSSGAVRIVDDLEIPLENRELLIVEDILDSGRTLKYISTILRGRNPNSIRICALLDKPSRRMAAVSADYVGFEIPDEFVVGYGLDYNEQYRNLQYIGVLKPDVYSEKDQTILNAGV